MSAQGKVAERNGIPIAAYRALDYAAASLGTILRKGPPKDAEGFAALADELDLIRMATRYAMDPFSQESANTILHGAMRDIFLA